MFNWRTTKQFMFDLWLSQISTWTNSVNTFYSSGYFTHAFTEEFGEKILSEIISGSGRIEIAYDFINN